MDRKFDGIILTVIHNVFKEITLEKLRKICSDKPFLWDVRNYFNSKDIKNNGFIRCSL